MPPDNYFIADQFSMLAKLMDIHGENPFKSRSYATAAFTIEKLPVQLSALAHEKIFTIKGIGEAIGKKIIQLLETGKLRQLDELIENTPPGVLEMLAIKGIGPKKISTIWKEMDIESIGELLYACNENRLLLYKGFGEKTQRNIQEALEFYLKNLGNHLYAQVEGYALATDKLLQEAFPAPVQTKITGAFAMQLEIISQLEWVTTAGSSALQQFLQGHAFEIESASGTSIACKGAEGIACKFFITGASDFMKTFVETSSGPDFLQACKAGGHWEAAVNAGSEQAFFAALHLPDVPAFQRDSDWFLRHPVEGQPIQPGDIRGIIHCHSNWSDGSNTIEALAAACMAARLEYLVLSDHSKSAFYANGLQEDRILAQHKHIDELNRQYAPFKIFKSIECDILNDGTLDYPDAVLSAFDLVIVSVHSNLKMTAEKANMRLLHAIENPYTTILGHMTGRLLLSRSGYPADHKLVIEACAANKVVIELNAHPRRLDMDWRWISYALDKGVLISVDPDAHNVEGFKDTRYGVLVAQKGGLTKAQNVSSFTLGQFENFLAARKKARGI